ncbi:MAG: Bug family tripartite tricarboxylate transporter substrate binding protein [Pseudomonadota bacterium]
MLSTRFARPIIAAALAAIAGASAGVALAQDKYPSRPVEIIVPWGPGGGADQVARTAGKMMEGIFGTSFPVVNVPGATGQTGLTKLLSAAPDGYTLGIMTGDTFSLLGGSGKLSWSKDDFVPAAIMIRQPSAFFVKEGGPINSWDDLVAEAKKRPLKVAVTGFGSPDDIHVNYFKKKGINLVSVPFAKPGERYSSILGGHADVLYEQLGDVKSFLENKQMKPVVIFDDKRFPAFGDVPSSKELGYPISIYQFRMVLLKAGTDPAKIKTISDALAKVAADPEYKKYLESQYALADSYIDADGAKKFLDKELANMKKFAAEAGIQ